MRNISEELASVTEEVTMPTVKELTAEEIAQVAGGAEFRH